MITELDLKEKEAGAAAMQVQNLVGDIFIALPTISNLTFPQAFLSH